MSATPGPNIVTNGLVLAIDPANTAKLALGSISTNFIQNGYFANGQGSPQNNPLSNNPTNTFVILANPGESDYVLRQNGNLAEYQLDLTTELLPSTTYVMSGWYAKSSDYNDVDTMFHSRAFSASGANTATGNGIGTVIATKVVGGLTWSYCYQTITTPSDYNNDFDWYVGYGANNTTGFRYYTNLKVERGAFPSIPNLIINSNNGFVNDATYNSSNQGSLQLDGSNDYVDFTAPNLTTTATVEMWARIENIASNKMLMGWSYYDVYLSGGNLGFNTYNGDVYGISSATVNNLSLLNNWKHYVFEMRSDVPYTNNKMYINGDLQTLSQQSNSENSVNRTFNSGNGRISGSRVELTYLMPQRVGMFNVYNRSLTAAEVLQNFNALRGRYGI